MTIENAPREARRSRTCHGRVTQLSLLAALAATGCMRAPATMDAAQPRAMAATPRLVVLLAVDQLRGDMLDRYRDDMRHGYRRLMNGAWFVNGFQDHAITETAPGHATMLSGRFPRSTGIMSNSAGVVDRAYRLLNGPPTAPGASPHRFQGTTLFDWMAAQHPGARALSVSMKDRSAILMIGRARQAVYWYDAASGSFTTSNYYRDTLPAWASAFNAHRIPHSYAGREWRLSRDPATYRMPDSVPEENGGQSVFPFRFPDDTARATSFIQVTPAMDSLTARFALEGVRAMGLGQGPHTDLLAVSFSATDLVGHSFGPDSREAFENQVRLDETIGWFLDSLYRLRDSSSIVIALTGDHGVQPIQELARRRGEATGREGLIVSLRDQVAAVRGALAAAGVDSAALRYDGQLVGLERAPVAAAGLSADSILNAFATRARAVPGVSRVDWMRDIRRADFTKDTVARRWAHQVADAVGVDLVITLTRYSFWYPEIATHGSPYDLDTHVPVIFYGAGIRPGRHAQFVRVVDIAPTLAAVIGVSPREPLDGSVLPIAIAPSGPPPLGSTPL